MSAEDSKAATTQENALSGIQITDFEAGLDALTKAHMIKEEYRVWKKNAPLLYDTIINNTLDQVSLTVQWFSDMVYNEEKQYNAHRLLMGTQLGDEAEGVQNNVIISEVRLPTQDKANHDGTFNKKLTNTGRVEVVQRIVHNGDVNRARYMPQNPNILATKSQSADVYVFDRTLHPSKPAKNAEFNPQLRLVGHTQEGYGLSWSSTTLGKVISGSGDQQILMWDISQSGINTQANKANDSKTSGGDAIVADATTTTPATLAKNALEPIQKFSAHTDIVEEVAFFPTVDHMFVSCGDDKLICVWDTRTAGTDPVFKVLGHTAEVNSVSCNPNDANIFISGSSDKTVGLWDIRNMTKKLHSFEHHTDQVFSIQWSPFNNSVFASSGCDRRVLIWDLERIGEEQDPEDAEDGPPELFFQHAGHTDKVNDIAWASTKEWLLASVADDDILHVWEPAKAVRDEVYGADDESEDEIDDDDLE